MDLILSQLFWSRLGLVVHVMMYVGNKNVNWPSRLSDNDDVYWWNVLARIAPHPAVILDVSKEAGSYGVGQNYVYNRLRLIHRLNSHHRLVTAHSGLNWSGKCPGCNLTMVSLQSHSINHTDGGYCFCCSSCGAFAILLLSLRG